MNSITRPSILALLSISLFLALWYALAIYLDTLTLPTPLVVAKVLLDEIKNGQLPYHLSKTLYRLLISFGIAMLLGCAIGIALGRYKQLDYFFDNWLIIFLNIPALVTIILCYVWFGLVESAAILAVVINKLPN
ncbi:MAG: ABC transporter permease, partial [Gammaproteobacteria bacterium]|nr:ABC transporter permease [Gammaproteobacteria bacterium]